MKEGYSFWMGLEGWGRRLFTTLSVQSYKVRAQSSSVFLLHEFLHFSSMVVGLHIPCSRFQLMDWMNIQVAVSRRTANELTSCMLPGQSSGTRLGLNIAMLLKLWTVLFVIFATTYSSWYLQQPPAVWRYYRCPGWWFPSNLACRSNRFSRGHCRCHNSAFCSLGTCWSFTPTSEYATGPRRYGCSRICTMASQSQTWPEHEHQQPNPLSRSHASWQLRVSHYFHLSRHRLYTTTTTWLLFELDDSCTSQCGCRWHKSKKSRMYVRWYPPLCQHQWDYMRNWSWSSARWPHPKWIPSLCPFIKPSTRRTELEDWLPCSVRRSSLLDWKKDWNWTEPNRKRPDHRLRLHKFWIFSVASCNVCWKIKKPKKNRSFVPSRVEPYSRTFFPNCWSLNHKKWSRIGWDIAKNIFIHNLNVCPFRFRHISAKS